MLDKSVTKNANVIEIALVSQRLGYLHKMFALDLIETVLTYYYELFCKVRTSSGSFHTSSPYYPVMFIAPGTLLPLIPMPPLSATSRNALSSLLCFTGLASSLFYLNNSPLNSQEKLNSFLLC